MIDAHRGAFEYDWRTRFHKSLKAIGRGMSWGEAIRLTQRLSMDPSSHVGAALAGWAHPLSREAMVLMDQFDLTHMSLTKRKPDPYPRPWVSNKRRFGSGKHSPAELRAILDKHRAEATHG